MYYHLQGITNVKDDWTYEIKHSYENKPRICYVVYNEPTFECECSCHVFDSDGIPCAHMLPVFTSDSLREILVAYIINRCTKMAAKVPMYEFDSVVGDACGEIATQNKLIGDVRSQFQVYGSGWAHPCQSAVVIKFNDFSQASTSGYGWRVNE